MLMMGFIRSFRHIEHQAMRPVTRCLHTFKERPHYQKDGFDTIKDKGQKWKSKQQVKLEPIYGYYEGDHIYGLQSVLAALKHNKRNISELLIQENSIGENRKDQSIHLQILDICKRRNIAIRTFSKHDLNMLCDSRPHQGYILRAKPLEYITIKELSPSPDYKCVLALDEITDPQNFGSLLRSAHFFGADKVVVCGKNSSPPSPAVSKASAGSLEARDVYSVNNMMRFLDNCRNNGWQVIGTSVDPEKSIPLSDLPLSWSKPIVLVLGSEGSGMRTNVANKCDLLVRIDNYNHQVDFSEDKSKSAGSTEGEGEASTADDLDSLNVGVCGGVLMHYFMHMRKIISKSHSSNSDSR